MMRKRVHNDSYILLVVVIMTLSLIFSHSCANTTQSPSGGPKDTIPPVLLHVNPNNGVVGVPLSGAKFSFTFDEYVKVKSATNITLSPPQTKMPKTKMKGKTLIVSFEEPFDSNTTYTLSFPDAIADNNENNVFPGFTYVFSTGQYLDSMMLNGVVQDCSTLNPLKGATVMLYKDLSDSAVMLSKPFATAKTDDWGYFLIRNIPDTLYRLYAIEDKNNDHIYDPNTERIAFVDGAIRPKNVVNDSLPEVINYDVKDTVHCLARKTEYEMNVFREKPRQQYIKNSGRTGRKKAFVSFMAPGAHIDTLWMRGVPSNRIISQFNIERDSLELWVNDRRRLPDTLHLFVNYRKTDSLGNLVPEVEEVKLANKPEDSQKNTTRFSRSQQVITHQDTICVLKLTADPENVDQTGFTLTFDEPIIWESFDSIKFTIVNPRQQESAGKFTVERDSLDLRIYHLRPKDKLLYGFDYTMKVPHRGFRDINGYYNDSTELKVTLPNADELSSIILNIGQVNDNKYIVDLLNEQNNIVRQYIINQYCTLEFPYLKPGRYSIRITEDLNRNGIVDTGSLLDHRQPEKVKFYKINDKPKIEIKETMQIEQYININDMFNGAEVQEKTNDEQKPQNEVKNLSEPVDSVSVAAESLLDSGRATED